jgi:hypothetical protein
VPTDQQVLGLLPDNLNFVLRWQGNANLDLQVGTILGGEVVYPASGLAQSKSGGKTAFDHQGGPNGGIEIVSWPTGFPRDTYVPGVNHISGPTVPANLQVYRDGKLCTKTISTFEDGVVVFKEVGCIVTGFDPQTGQPIFGSSVNFNVAPPRANDPRLALPGNVDFLAEVTTPGANASTRTPALKQPTARPSGAGRRR